MPLQEVIPSKGLDKQAGSTVERTLSRPLRVSFNLISMRLSSTPILIEKMDAMDLTRHMMDLTMIPGLEVHTPRTVSNYIHSLYLLFALSAR
jgi:hypothetical protein